MRVSTSTKASMLACGSCRPRIHTTSVRDGSTVSGQPPRPEEPEQPKMGLFQTPARRGRAPTRKPLNLPGQCPPADQCDASPTSLFTPYVAPTRWRSVFAAPVRGVLVIRTVAPLPFTMLSSPSHSIVMSIADLAVWFVGYAGANAMWYAATMAAAADFDASKS